MTARRSVPGARWHRVHRCRALDDDEELRGLDEDEELRGLDEDEELRGFAEDDELRGLDEDEELRGFAEDEELRGLAEDEDFRGMDQGYVRERHERAGSLRAAAATADPLVHAAGPAAQGVETAW